jgi:hypothetical protein
MAYSLGSNPKDWGGANSAGANYTYSTGATPMNPSNSYGNWNTGGTPAATGSPGRGFNVYGPPGSLQQSLLPQPSIPAAQRLFADVLRALPAGGLLGDEVTSGRIRDIPGFPVALRRLLTGPRNRAGLRRPAGVATKPRYDGNSYFTPPWAQSLGKDAVWNGQGTVYTPGGSIPSEVITKMYNDRIPSYGPHPDSYPSRTAGINDSRWAGTDYEWGTNKPGLGR